MTPEDIAQRARTLELTFGVRIDYLAVPEAYTQPTDPLPEGVGRGNIGVVDPRAVPAALDSLEQALSLYPSGFVARFCSSILLCDFLRREGRYAGGTYGNAWILLVANYNAGTTAIAESCRLGLHHELSSFVWRRSSDLHAVWQRALPTDWNPAEDSAHALQRSGVLDFRRTDGFLSDYATSSAENDFNTYAEAIFGSPLPLMNAARRLDLVRAKASSFMQVYCNLDARMAGVFKRLGLADILHSEPLSTTWTFSVAPVAVPAGVVQ